MFDFSRRKATESTESRDVDMEPRQDAETSDEGAADSEDALEATEGYYRAVESENHTEEDNPTDKSVWLPLFSRERKQKYWKHKYSGQVLFNEPAEIEFVTESMESARMGRVGSIASHNILGVHMRKSFQEGERVGGDNTGTEAARKLSTLPLPASLKLPVRHIIELPFLNKTNIKKKSKKIPKFVKKWSVEHKAFYWIVPREGHFEKMWTDPIRLADIGNSENGEGEVSNLDDKSFEKSDGGSDEETDSGNSSENGSSSDSKSVSGSDSSSESESDSDSGSTRNSQGESDYDEESQSMPPSTKGSSTSPQSPSGPSVYESTTNSDSSASSSPGSSSSSSGGSGSGSPGSSNDSDSNSDSNSSSDSDSDSGSGSGSGSD